MDIVNNRGRRQLSNYKNFIFDITIKEKEESILDKRNIKNDLTESESEQDSDDVNIYKDETVSNKKDF
jgi:hypothetical protein